MSPLAPGGAVWAPQVAACGGDRTPRPAPPPPQSECYKDGGTLDDCKKTVPREKQECEALRQGVFACRRGQLDNRSRIRGNKGY